MRDFLRHLSLTLLLAVAIASGCGGGGTSGAGSGSAASEPARVTGFNGPFYTVVNGNTITTSLTLQQGTVSGVIDDMKFSAQVNGTEAAGDAFDLSGQKVGVVKMALAGDRMTVDVTITHPDTGQSIQVPTLNFTRGAPPPPPPVDPSLDTRLVGQWRYTWTAASGGVSMAIDYWLILRADGTSIYGKAKSAGGGGTVGIESQVDGQKSRWKTSEKILYIKPDGETEWQSFARYAIDGDRMLLTYANGSKEIYQRQ